ncbi:Response regulator MprA [Novipirellula galeiformis]|uniref:Response regulator MprA n=1 Tax=Novipirellula galeiformis TaxID=2528004 RepID=A0A5C6CCQ1_9BACT|nr:response regulator [Novipirellula galeiformis]TWU21196.1 Response regulator MprA [Novipirellula galeiformis]
MARVLLVEDSRTQAILLRAMLEEDSHDVHVAGDGVEALELIFETMPEIVVTDMQMPNMNGLELVRALRKQHPAIPVILITAQGSEELSAQALQEGAAAYLPKSVVDEELLGSIEHVLALMATQVSYRDLIKRLDYNQFQFTLENDPSLISPLVHLMQQVASGMHFSDDVTRARIGMAIEQALLNAMFRGNLEISREAQLEDEELQVSAEMTLVQRRRSESPYGDRRVLFRAHLGHTELVFIITDEGPGFDAQALMSADASQVLEIERGRGLVLIRSFMDEVRFNEAGNEIVMIKRF